MTKSELRKARKAARESGRRLTGDLAIRRGESPDPLDSGDRDRGNCSFSESYRGRLARDRWASRYDELNGAPEGDWDR